MKSLGEKRRGREREGLGWQGEKEDGRGEKSEWVCVWGVWKEKGGVGEKERSRDRY